MTISVYPSTALSIFIQIAGGFVPGTTAFVGSASQSALPSGNFYPVWENASYYPTYPSSAATQYVTSTSASDTSVQILVSGVNASYVLTTETVTLNGTAFIATANTYLRINSISVSGTKSPVGTITIGPSSSTTTTVYAVIGLTTQNGSSISNGRSNMSVYTVPAGYTLYTTREQGWVAGGGANYATFRIFSQNTGIPTVYGGAPFVESGYNVTQVSPLVYPAKTDIQWQLSVVNSTAVSVQVEGILIAS